MFGLKICSRVIYMSPKLYGVVLIAARHLPLSGLFTKSCWRWTFEPSTIQYIGEVGNFSPQLKDFVCLLRVEIFTLYSKFFLPHGAFLFCRELKLLALYYWCFLQNTAKCMRSLSSTYIPASDKQTKLFVIFGTD